MKRATIIKSYFSILFVFAFVSCKQSVNYNSDRVVIRLEQEPDNLNPILSSSSAAREVYEYIYLSLCDFNPSSMELEPVLIKELPLVRVEANGDISYEMEILDEAMWEDGVPVTSLDFEFTLKMVCHPRITNTSWRSLLDDIRSVQLDPENPRKIKVITRGEYFLNYEAIVTFELFPAHIYDPNNVLASYPLELLANEDFTGSSIATDTAFINLGERFSSVEFSKNRVVGCGPYKLRTWNSEQFIILEKVPNYWGANFPNRTSLNAFPGQIIFQIVPDQNTALTLLKNDEIDLMDMTKIPYVVFNELKSDSLFSRELEFHSPSIYRYYFLLLNNEDIRLKDRNVREALNHLMDVNRIINQIEGGYGQRISSIIHPNKPQNNKTLKPIEFNASLAIKLLEESDWKDSDGDGVRDKLISGKKESLKLRFFITSSALSQSISSILKEYAIQAGIQIDIIPKDFQATRIENLIPGDFEISTMAIGSSEVRDDPFNSWHSSSIGNGGTNYSRYNNPEADQLMEVIRTTKDEEKRNQAYQKLQEIMYRDYPVIFLYAPTLRLAVDSEFIPVISSKRPGYFANAFKLES